MLVQIQLYQKTKKLQLTPHFSLDELKCKCSKCHYVLVSQDHLLRLEVLREKISRPIHINSGYRCCTHNFIIGGEPGSYHLCGVATDIRVYDYDIFDLRDLCKKLFDGVGFYQKEGFIHVDSRGHKVYWEK